MNLKVAIVQNYINKGGRFSVLARMIKNLNNRGVIPDIITGGISFDLSETESLYGYPIQANLINNKSYNKHLAEYHILSFNRKVTSLIKGYDWVINSSNTAHYLSHPNLFDYIHFPRFWRILHKETYKNRSGAIRVMKYLEYAFVKYLYKNSEYPNCEIYTNSNFTSEKLIEVYPKLTQSTVFYPPVLINENAEPRTYSKRIINMGRFHPTKKQFELILLAQKIPDYRFDIVGFANESDPYLDKCAKYIVSNDVKNVFLHPNASVKKRDKLLSEASYFIHLLHNEPFGISTVQAIAKGCIPIVPNSGGQKEVVPIKDLYFEDLEDIKSIIDKIDEMSNEERMGLFDMIFAHIKQFGSKQFDKKFNKIIDQQYA